MMGWDGDEKSGGVCGSVKFGSGSNSKGKFAECPKRPRDGGYEYSYIDGFLGELTTSDTLELPYL